MSLSSVSIKESHFVMNYDKILYLYNVYSKIKMSFIGPISIKHNVSKDNLIVFVNVIVDVYGPVIISYNNVKKETFTISVI